MALGEDQGLDAHEIEQTLKCMHKSEGKYAYPQTIEKHPGFHVLRSSVLGGKSLPVFWVHIQKDTEFLSSSLSYVLDPSRSLHMRPHDPPEQPEAGCHHHACFTDLETEAQSLPKAGHSRITILPTENSTLPPRLCPVSGAEK